MLCAKYFGNLLIAFIVKKAFSLFLYGQDVYFALLITFDVVDRLVAVSVELC